jgi:sarcosine oxidase subunit gamma
VAELVDPFRGALAPGRFGIATEQPVRISARRYALVQLTARRGQAEPLVTSIRGAFGLQLPKPGIASSAGEQTALWMQPDSWLLMAPAGPEGQLARAVQRVAGTFGSVVDQTHGRVVLSLAGDRAREVLARLCRIDLHPRVFGPGRVAATSVAELSCLVFQRDARPSFDVIVSASYAGWFLDAVTHAAASVGYEVPDGGSTAKLRAGAL